MEGFSIEENTIERQLKGKKRIEFQHDPSASSVHYGANMYRADHQPNMFTHYWREPLQPRLKFVLDPTF